MWTIVDRDLHDVCVDTRIGAGLILTHFRVFHFHANLDLIMSLCTLLQQNFGQDLVEKMLARLKRTDKLDRLVEVLNSHDFNHLVFWRQAWI